MPPGKMLWAKAQGVLSLVLCGRLYWAQAVGLPGVQKLL